MDKTRGGGGGGVEGGRWEGGRWEIGKFFLLRVDSSKGVYSKRVEFAPRVQEGRRDVTKVSLIIYRV